MDILQSRKFRFVVISWVSALLLFVSDGELTLTEQDQLVELIKVGIGAFIGTHTLTDLSVIVSQYWSSVEVVEEDEE